MQKFYALLIFGIIFHYNVLAQHHSHDEQQQQQTETAQTNAASVKTVGSQKKTLTRQQLDALEKAATQGAKDGNALVFKDNAIRLVVRTGPEDDMLSYRLQDLRNPTLIFPAKATINVLFINTDGDMSHDIRFGTKPGEFQITPESDRTVGTTRLAHAAEDDTLTAEEVVIKAPDTGEFVYFCSVRGHAKGGMWGNLVVGKKARPDLSQPIKTEHVHSPDEEKMSPNTDESKPHNHAEADASETHLHKEHQTAEKHSEMPGMNKEEMAGMAGGNQDEMPDMNQHDMAGMSGMAGMNHSHDEMTMRSVVDLNVPMTRESSGTAWAADSSPMYARMKMLGNGDMLMFHGMGFLRYTSVGSTRDLSVGGKGDRARFDAPTMFMAMYSHQLSSKSQIGVRAMLSLDPLFERGYGYPLLYQSGEAYRGRAIHDRQHPHDLFSELSVSYSYKFTEKQSAFLYVGYPGEPALGPPTFMHRVSAMDNPDAPLSHHWQDSTHVTFGVVTAGYTFDKFKFEASAFKGQEPNENRWNFDRPKLDSFSGRLTFNPNKNWSFQISHGYLKNPEPAEPEIRVRRRTTASAIYNKNWADKDRNWANSFVWGQNHDDAGRTNSLLYESNYQFRKNSIFGRFERVQKSIHELSAEDFFVNDNQKFWVGLLSVGYVRDLVKDKGLDVGLGAQATWYTNPGGLTPVYGGTNHGGFQVFMRFRASRMKH